LFGIKIKRQCYPKTVKRHAQNLQKALHLLDIKSTKRIDTKAKFLNNFFN
jgi:hypothetical protein